jgi:hypothetical protein
LHRTIGIGLTTTVLAAAALVAPAQAGEKIWLIRIEKKYLLQIFFVSFKKHFL